MWNEPYINSSKKNEEFPKKNNEHTHMVKSERETDEAGNEI